MPGGPASVCNADEIVSLANGLQQRFDITVASQDWHPRDHCAFASSHPGKLPGDRVGEGGTEQVLWPVHCVADTPGAELVADLDQAGLARIYTKGTDPHFLDAASYAIFAAERVTSRLAFVLT